MFLEPGSIHSGMLTLYTAVVGHTVTGCMSPPNGYDQEIYEMAKGTAKWFNPTKGYGFIQPQGGGKDVFVHISAVEKVGLSTLDAGQAVEYVKPRQDLGREPEGSALTLSQ
jgi:CspA family cold shock protein